MRLKRLTFIIFFFSFLYSCNNMNESTEDNSIMEDYFEVDVLVPSDYLKKALSEIIYERFYDDSACVQIDCYAGWDVASTDTPYCIKTIGIDTSWFYLTIIKKSGQKSEMNWSIPEDRLFLRKIKSVLDTGSYTLRCINHDAPPKSRLKSYSKTIVYTAIDFNVCMCGAATTL